PHPPHPGTARPGAGFRRQRLRHVAAGIPAGNRQGLPAQGDLHRAQGIRLPGPGIRHRHLPAQDRGRGCRGQGRDPHRAGVRGRRPGRDLLRADQAGPLPLLRQGTGRQGHARPLRRALSMSALGRINLLVTLFFVLVTLVSLAVLLRQAGADVRRELQAAQLLVEHLADGLQAGERPLPPALERQLRHVQLRWLEPGQDAPQPHGGWLTPELPAPRLVQLADGRRLSLAVNPEDEIEEVWESLLQLLVLSGLALLACLLAIRWGVRQALGVLEELLGGLRQISRGRLATRLAQRRLPEAQRLVGQFNEMADSLQRAEQDNEALAQALLTLQEQERNRLAQALHDDLGQYLAGLRAQVRLLELIAEQPLAVRCTAQTLERHCEH